MRTAVVRQGLTLVGLGTTLGIAAAMATTPLLESLLYDVAPPQDPTTIGAVILLFTVLAAVAAYLPARRASAIDPLEALRQD